MVFDLLPFAIDELFLFVRYKKATSTEKSEHKDLDGTEALIYMNWMANVPDSVLKTFINPRNWDTRHLAWQFVHIELEKFLYLLKSKDPNESYIPKPGTFTFFPKTLFVFAVRASLKTSTQKWVTLKTSGSYIAKMSAMSICFFSLGILSEKKLVLVLGKVKSKEPEDYVKNDWNLDNATEKLEQWVRIVNIQSSCRCYRQRQRNYPCQVIFLITITIKFLKCNFMIFRETDRACVGA